MFICFYFCGTLHILLFATWAHGVLIFSQHQHLLSKRRGAWVCEENSTRRKRNMGLSFGPFRGMRRNEFTNPLLVDNVLMKKSPSCLSGSVLIEAKPQPLKNSKKEKKTTERPRTTISRPSTQILPCAFRTMLSCPSNLDFSEAYEILMGLSGQNYSRKSSFDYFRSSSVSKQRYGKNFPVPKTSKPILKRIQFIAD